VRISTLFEVVGGFDRALEAMGAELGIKLDDNETIIVPASVEESSLAFRGQLNPRFEAALGEVDRAFRSDDFAALPSSVRSEFRDVQKALGRRGATLDVTSDDITLHGVEFTGDYPDLSDKTDDIAEMTSHAVVYGICTRVNRTRTDAALALHDGSSCTLKDLTEDQLKLLMAATGEDFDQAFRAEGEATWNVEDYRITKMNVSNIRKIKRNAADLFDGLREITDGAYDDVDVFEDMKNVRASG
jgi:hypothetical protein